MNSLYTTIALIMLSLFLGGCEDLIEVDQPRTQLVSDAVFKDDLTATSAISGIYATVYSGFGSGSFGSVTHKTSYSSDERQLEEGDANLQFFENQIESTNANVQSLWTSLYSCIYRANAAIEKLEEAPELSPELRLQLLGEALFLRAFCHFYLVNLFGEVPYIKVTDYEQTGLVSRDPISAVYQNIIDDLNEAKTLLAEDYSHANDARVRANKWVATAMLARVYLYTEQWQLAEQQATLVINQPALYELNADLNAVFLKNSTETLLQLATSLHYVSYGGIFNQYYSSSTGGLTDGLVASFEAGDSRKLDWVGHENYPDFGVEWYYPLKYKESFSTGTGAEYYTVLRLAEQYLIRAEARAMQGKLLGADGAGSDINTIRNRAGLPNTTAATQQDFLEAIAQERKVEFFVEWAHRWFDLKRTGKADEVLGPLKSEWNSMDALYPIPYEELQLNPNLTQNDGY